MTTSAPAPESPPVPAPSPPAFTHRPGRVIWKTEGHPDMLSLLSMPDLPDDVSVICNSNGATENPANCEWVPELFRDAIVFIVHDADVPGQAGATWVESASGRRRPGWAPYVARFARECRNVILPHPIDHAGYDLRDWLNEGNTYENLLALAMEFPPTTPATDEELGSVLVAPWKSAGESSGASSGANGDPDPADPDGISFDNDEIDDEDDDRYEPPHEARDDQNRLARINLERYATHNGGATIRYWRSEFWTWKPARGCYRKMEKDEFKAKLHSSIVKIFTEDWREENEQYRDWLKSADYDEKIDKGPPTIRKVSMLLVSTVMAATSSLVYLRSSTELNTWIGDSDQGRDGHERRNYISMRNCILDIDAVLANKETDECMIPHSPRWFSTVTIPYAFDVNAESEFWENCVQKWMCGDIYYSAILQEFFGYALTHSTNEQKFLAFEGEGSNGKSACIAALTAVVGEMNCSHISLEDFSENQFATSHTIGKLLNCDSDVGELETSSVGKLKAFTSGDKISCRRMYLPPIECYPTARMVLSFNSRPRFPDKSGALWRRMLLIPFDATISNEEKIKGMDKASWWNDSGHLPAIFRWALIGLHRLRQQGDFTYCRKMEERVEGYRQDMNPARTFLLEHMESCDPTTNPAEETKRIYRLYVKWCEENGCRPLNNGHFGKEITRAFPKSEKKRIRDSGTRSWAYSGIKFSVDEICGEKINNLDW